ncbi:methyltransferase domain-containing protein [Aeromonas veronii]|uniref:methyltransferase domain-containing protein n=1 Tax=Aeromonas veronii TaxID=654 RepID=UPI0024168BE8|nr:methyltransferase domain-containing protein [Aeromonas veronii]WFO52668.1 methyltransferase domain-containing protein [Aeromonas veronii]
MHQTSQLETIVDEFIQSIGYRDTLVIGSDCQYVKKHLNKKGINSFLNHDDAIIDSAGLDTAIIYNISADKIFSVFSDLYHANIDSVYISLELVKENEGLFRKDIEEIIFSCGYKKKHSYYNINNYSEISDNDICIHGVYEKIRTNSISSFPFSLLLEERDLHMDMMRESGSRSDAHIYRYKFACDYIRPGDRVLDAACGLGYGSHVIAHQSKAKSVLGVDGSRFAIEYANATYADESTKYMEGYLPDTLSSYSDASFDIIISFETLEHVENPESVLNEFYRLLSPGGRLITSVPNDWSDESGEDPNPFHFHVYKLEKFDSQLGALFDIESYFAQTADRVKLLHSDCMWERRGRSLHQIDLNRVSVGVESEWILAIVTKDPTDHKHIDYNQTLFYNENKCVLENVISFERDYNNPWLVKSLISIGWCAVNEDLREKWADKILSTYPSTSADYGAALCIKLYRYLDDINDKSLVISENTVNEYLLLKYNSSVNPTVKRWVYSIAYVYGLIKMYNGDYDSAEKYFEIIDCDGVCNYDLTLLTKYVLSFYWRCILSIDDKNRCVTLIDECASNVISSLKFIPTESIEFPDFYLRELSSVVALLSQLVSFKNNYDNIKYKPSLFNDELSSNILSRLYLEVDKSKKLKFLIHDAESKHHDAVFTLNNKINLIFEGKEWLEKAWTNEKNNGLLLTSRLDNIQKNLSENELQLAAARDMLSEKDLQLEATRDMLSEKDLQLEATRDMLSEKDLQLEATRDMLSEREVELAILHERLQKIESSYWFKFIKMVRNLRGQHVQ